MFMGKDEINKMPKVYRIKRKKSKNQENWLAGQNRQNPE